MTPARLKQIRQKAAPGISQAAFARALDYTPQAYNRFEQGHRSVPPRLALLAEMIDMHGLPARWVKGEA